MDMGRTIRLLRERHGFKQVNLANALQVSPQAVSKWEKGANLPDVGQLLKISRLFDVSVDYLLGATDAESGIFEATVLCTGVARFAQRSAAVGPRDVAEYINGLFYHLTESALRFDGIPVKYVGDGFLCFFSGPDHADRAIDAAKQARKVVYQQDLAIAINTGEIYLGLVGHPHYAMRDIIGATVNRAFLVLGWVSENCPSRVGATESTINRAERACDTVRHPGVKIDLIGEKVDLFEIT
jgi:class 3 adenylate cyclase